MAPKAGVCHKFLFLVKLKTDGKGKFLESLSLKATAIGSLPHDNPQEALNLVFDTFKDIPFWPQLANVHRFEDMIIQFNQGIPGIRFDGENEKFFCNTQSDEFFEELEEFFLDYESIVGQKNFENLEKYAITPPYSSAFEPFLEKLKNAEYKYVKSNVTGPFTWGTSLCDTDGKCSFYDETYREVLVKGITLKAIWQIQKFKSISPDITPIIFIDEPVLSQYGTSAFVTVQRRDLVYALAEIAGVIKDFGGLCGVHCCGKADWSLLIDAEIDIINLDAYNYAQSLSVHADRIAGFLKNGGYIAWGMIPTLDKTALEGVTPDILMKKFDKAVACLQYKGINPNLVYRQSIITPSCGAGGLSVELAQKAMFLTNALAEKIAKHYEVL